MEQGREIAEYLTAGFLLAGSFFDLKNRELPARFLFGFAAAGVLWNIAGRYQSFFHVFTGCILGGIVLFLGKITKESIGYGDGLGILGMGIFLGGRNGFIVLTAAFLLAALYGLSIIFVGRGKISGEMPFFPFLFLASLGGMFL